MATKRADVAAEHCEKLFAAYESDTSTLRNNWQKWMRAYKCLEASEDKEYTTEKSKIKIPTRRMLAEVASNNIMEIIFATDPFFKLTGRQQQDKMAADYMSALIEFYFYVQNFPREVRPFLIEMCALGTGIGHVAVDQHEHLSVDYEKEEMDIGGEIMEMGYKSTRNITVHNRPRFRHIQLQNFFIEPNAKDIQTCEMVIVRDYKSLHELRKLERLGIIDRVDDLEANISASSSTDNQESRKSSELSQRGMTYERSEDEVIVKTAWGWMEKDILKDAGYKGEIEDGGAEVMCIFANDTCLKLVENPHISKRRPFVKEVYSEIPGEFYGLGIFELADGPARALDTLIRQRIDNRSAAIHCFWGIDTTKIEKDEDFKMHPNKILLTKGDPSNAIKQYTVQDVTSGSYPEASELERYIQESANISKQAGGMPVSKEQSATEANLIASAAGLTLKHKALDVERSVILPVLEWYVEIIMEFMNTDEIISVTDENGVAALQSITPYNIIGQYDLIPQGTLIANKKAELPKMLNAMQIFSNPIWAARFNLNKMGKDVLELMFGPRKAAEYELNIDPTQATMMAMQAGAQGSPPAMDMGGGQQTPLPGGVQESGALI